MKFFIFVLCLKFLSINTGKLRGITRRQNRTAAFSPTRFSRHSLRSFTRRAHTKRKNNTFSSSQLSILNFCFLRKKVYICPDY